MVKKIYPMCIYEEDVPDTGTLVIIDNIERNEKELTIGDVVNVYQFPWGADTSVVPSLFLDGQLVTIESFYKDEYEEPWFLTTNNIDFDCYRTVFRT
jgi:hypothetical protein